MEDDFWRSLMYFFSGTFSYRLVSTFLRYNHLYYSFYDTVNKSLQILVMTDESITLTNSYKYDYLKEMDISPEELEKIKSQDRATLLTWREMVIKSMLSISPRHLRLSSKFTTWNQAMNYFNSLPK
jgi:hypothetical protein